MQQNPSLGGRLKATGRLSEGWRPAGRRGQPRAPVALYIVCRPDCCPLTQARLRSG
jgi:hypothetical protein